VTRIALVPNPNLKKHGAGIAPDPYLPLGLVSIATLLDDAGCDVEIVDINGPGSEASYGRAAEAIMDRDPDVVGFSTMCNQYTNTIKMARACKEIKPDATIVFGGPEATITDEATLRAFPFVDLIVRGECEQSIVRILRQIGDRASYRHLPGLTFREGRNIVATPSLPAIDDLDQLPIPNYGLYPNLDLLGEAPLEVGRGCPFGCTFCSTSRFWQRKYRLRSTANLVAQIKTLSSDHGFRKFSFQHDNLTVSRQRVLELCAALEQEDLDITWTCSSRIDCLDTELLNRMARAGCTSIFIGVESGSPRMQELIGKKLDLTESLETVKAITAAGMSFTASFMMGFPSETMDDLLQTIELMMQLKFEGNGAEAIQLHMLAPTPGTELHSRHGHQLLFDNRFSDMAITELTDEDYSMIKKHPQVFCAFYYYDTPHIERDLLVRINYLMMQMHALPYTSYVLWKDPRCGFPHEIMRQLSALPVPEGAWDSICGAENVARVSRFLHGALCELGLKDHYVHDVIKYEEAANRVAESLAGSADVVEEFAYGVHDLIERIARKEVEGGLPPVRRDEHHLLFSKIESKVQCTRLSTKVAELFSA
jgi:radical SAM superfamily enzyme YgiQ (UPF0313 family)